MNGPCTKIHRAYFATFIGYWKWRRMAHNLSKRIITTTFNAGGSSVVTWADC